MLTPESAMRIQNQLGADVIMAFDDCPPSVDPGACKYAGEVRSAAADAAIRDATEPEDSGEAGARPRLRAKTKSYDHAARLKLANERTIRWLERCDAEHRRLGGHERRSLFGIVQGGTDLDARAWSAEHVTNIELPGYAIGGVAVGEQSDEIARVVAHTAPLLPETKPRYLMGVGYEPRDLLAAVYQRGWTCSTCVLPTRNGRNANAFTPTGQIRLRNAKFADDPNPIEPGCDCPACAPGPARGLPWASPGDQPFSRAYIRHLFFAEGDARPDPGQFARNLRYFQRFHGRCFGPPS